MYTVWEAPRKYFVFLERYGHQRDTFLFQSEDVRHSEGTQNSNSPIWGQWPSVEVVDKNNAISHSVCIPNDLHATDIQWLLSLKIHSVFLAGFTSGEVNKWLHYRRTLVQVPRKDSKTYWNPTVCHVWQKCGNRKFQTERRIICRPKNWNWTFSRVHESYDWSKRLVCGQCRDLHVLTKNRIDSTFSVEWKWQKQKTGTEACRPGYAERNWSDSEYASDSMGRHLSEQNFEENLHRCLCERGEHGTRKEMHWFSAGVISA